MGLAELQQVDPRELRDFAIEFGDVVRALPFQLPENFLLIIRAMSLTSGMCSSLDPDFNMWDAVEPYAGQLLRDERGNVVQAFGKEALSVAGVVARLPQRLDDLADRIEKGRLAVDNARARAAGARGSSASARRIVSAVLFAGLLHRRDPAAARARRSGPSSRRRRCSRCFTPCSRESSAGEGDRTSV